MQNNFKVAVVAFKAVSETEGVWGAPDHKALLELMGLDDGLETATADELKEMCHMSLNDFEPNEAARFVLSYLFGDELTEGKIDQLSHEMEEDRLWEEHSDSLHHKTFFKAYSLLRRAFNGVFPQPTGVRFTVSITPVGNSDLGVFSAPPHAALVRLLAAGLGEREILHRLYEEQIAGDRFESAQGILWEVKQLAATDTEIQYELLSSAFWFNGLADVDTFEATTHADAVDDES